MQKIMISHLEPKTILLSFDQALSFVDDCIKQNKKEIIVTLNTEMFVDSLNESDDLLSFKNIVKNSAVVLDSIGICYLFKKKTNLNVDVVNGIDLAERIMEKGYRTFIVGSTTRNVSLAVENLKRKGFNVVGYNDGYFSQDDKLIEQINSVNTEVLLVGMGSPKQEKWLYKNFEALEFRIGMGIGGSIDVWAGVYKRAPIFLRKLKLEWLYRTLVDFRRLPRLYKLLKFAVLVNLGRV